MKMDSTERSLLIGTFNRGKIKEIQKALQHLDINLRTPDEFPHLSVVDETGTTYKGNATLKAEAYWKQTGIPTVGDDSGLEVEALAGGPGVLSARYGGPDNSDEDRVKLLLAKLGNETNRRARFVCVIAFAEPSGVTLFEAHCSGVLSTEPRGEKGFGYDPIFVPNGYNQTFGELPSSIKDLISHRGKALAKFRDFLTTRLLDRPMIAT